MSEIEINDVRIEKDFKSISFSGFKKSEVMKELLNTLMNNKVENAVYWGCELICAGHYLDLWNVLLNFVGKYVHLANPKLPLYLEMRMDDFRNVISSGYIGQELRLRNNKKLRKLFAEIISVLCLSNRKPCFEGVKIKKQQEFDISQMTERFKAPSADYATVIFRKEDPRELFIAINELSYNIKNKDLMRTCYWMEWIIEYETISKSKKQKCKCDRRAQMPVSDKEQMDVVWMIWELIVYYGNKEGGDKQKVINSILGLFCLRYTNGILKKRKFLLYFAVSLLT